MSRGNPNGAIKSINGFIDDQSKSATSQKTVKYPSGAKITHTGYPINSIVQQYVQYTYDMWGMDLVIIMQCEQSRQPWLQSKSESSYWLCQIYWPDHRDIINDSRFWTDWKWEVEQCSILMKWWTKFFWPKRIDKKNWQPCYINAQKYFTISFD